MSIRRRVVCGCIIVTTAAITGCCYPRYVHGAYYAPKTKLERLFVKLNWGMSEADVHRALRGEKPLGEIISMWGHHTERYVVSKTEYILVEYRKGGVEKSSGMVLVGAWAVRSDKVVALLKFIGEEDRQPISSEWPTRATEGTPFSY